MVNQRMKILAPVLIVLLFILAVGMPVMAAGGPRVVDLANVLSPADESALEQKATEIGAKFNMDLVIVTTNDTGGRSAMDFADDYFDYNGYGVGDSRDGALFLIDFANRQTWISTSGDKTIEALTDAQIENILDDVYAHLHPEGPPGKHFLAYRWFARTDHLRGDRARILCLNQEQL